MNTMSQMPQEVDMEQLPIEIREHAKTVVEKFSIYSDFLSGLGYQKQEAVHIIDNQTHHPSTTITYTKGNRKVHIGFYYYDGKNKEVGRLGVSISKIPHAEWGDTIILDLLIQKE